MKTKLDMAGLEKLKRDLAAHAKTRANVGILAKNNGRDDGETNADVGFKLEFGTREEQETTPAQEAARGRGHMTWAGTPARSWLLFPTQDILPFYIYKYKNTITKDLIEKGPEAALARIGQLGVIAIDSAFSSKGFGAWPDNSSRTVLWKGSDQPGIDSSQLRDAVAYEVKT